MQYKTSLPLFVLTVLLIASPASARKDYFRADIGGAFARDTRIKGESPSQFYNPNEFPFKGKVGDSFAVDFGFGSDYGIFRTDVTGSYRPGFDLSLPHNNASHIKTKGSVRTLGFMWNGYLELANLMRAGMGRIFPYLGGGIGMTHNKIHRLSTTNASTGARFSTPGGTKTQFAWNVGAGLAFKATERFNFDIGYKYVDLGKIETKNGPASTGAPVGKLRGAKIKAHEAMIGIRWYLYNTAFLGK